MLDIDKLDQLKKLFINKQYDEIITEIENIKDKNSLYLNILGAARLNRNNLEKQDRENALSNFEEAYLKDNKTENGLNAIINYINVATDLNKFDKIFDYIKSAKSNFGEDEKLLEAIQRFYQFQHNTTERNKVLEIIIKNKSKSVKIWSSYLYNNNFLSNSKTQEDHYNLAKKFSEVLPSFKLPYLQIDKNIKERKINIGFLSADLNQNHSVNFFLKGLLKNLDKEKFKLIAIGNWKEVNFTNLELRENFDEWFSINNLQDLDAINLIRSKKIDIIFDIMGMTGENRPTLFKNRIAPIQINWLGYCNTSGLKNMDFIFADPHLIKDGEERYYSEKVKKLSYIWNSHSGLPVERKLVDLPVKHAGKFTFGSFNNFNKISNETLNCWEKILKSSKRFRIYLKSSVEYYPNHLLSKFKERGIENQITILKKSKTFIDHLKMYEQIDLALDTFPYNGVTTTFEALWQSVPVLTLRGDNFLSRNGYSIIKNLGIDELISNSSDDYVLKAINLSNNFNDLKKIKKKIYENLLNSKLFDIELFTQSFENALLECVNEKLQ